MIHGQMWKLHDDAAIARIDDAAMRLLVRGGSRIENDHLLDLLEAAGCRIERGAMRCYFTEKLIRKALAHFGGQNATEIRIGSGWSAQLRMAHSGSHPHIVEWPSGIRRLATRQDVVDMARMAHVLDEFAVVGRVFTCSDVNPRVEPLWNTLQLAKISTKPIGGGEVFFADYLDPLMRMGEVLSGRPGDTSLISGCDFFVAPLILERNQAACFVEKRRLGMDTGVGTMPVSGMSAPVTIAGTVTLALAELIAGWVLSYVVNPALPVSGSVASGSLDMRTTMALFGSPEAILQNVATANVARRLYDIPVWPVVNYTDCKRPGLEAAFDKMYGLLCAAFSDTRGIGTDGLLSAGQDYSPVQQMLDHEMLKAVERFWGHFEINDETLAADLILKQMRAPGTNFLDTEHTLLNYQAEQWYPRWFDRRAWQGTDEEKNAEQRMLQRISDYCQDAVRRYEPPEIDPSRIAELERIYQTTARALPGA